ncbi:MAG TPA: ABC transporter substrate-binding protein [bacterium]|nr:ABC transporter substrate-binding protein [bacterium]
MLREHETVTRRALLRLLGASAGAATLGGLLQGAGTPPAAGAPAKDTLTVAQTVDIPTFDPQRALGIDAIVAIANMYDRLVYLDYDNKIRPWLATSWEASPDGLTWTFHLRADAKFHDGAPVTSDAVKYTIERAVGPGTGASLSKTYLAAIVKVDTPDARTVRLTTKDPLGPMLRNVGHQTALAVLNPKIVDAHNGDLSRPVDAGSGMYKLAEWKPNEQLVLERNDAWWGPKPYFRRIIYRPVPDAATRSIMLEKGEADVATVLPLADVPQLRKNRAVRIIASNSIRSTFFAIQMGRPGPMMDVRVRKALNYAVDVGTIIKSVLEGQGQPERSVLGANMEFYYPVYTFDYDPARAKQLLAEAGVKPGTRVVIEGPQGRWPGDAEMVQAVAGYLRAVGFAPQVSITGDWAQYNTVTNRSKTWDLYMTAWAPGNLDADGTFTAVTWSKGFNNYGNYSNPNADALLEQGRASIDAKVRDKYYRALQQLLAQDVPYVLLQTAVSFSGTRADICGVEVRGDDANFIKNAKTC